MGPGRAKGPLRRPEELRILIVTGGLAPIASGANSVASALGNRTRRDPSTAVRTYHEGRPPTLKSGTFYLAGNRNFLFGSDTAPTCSVRREILQIVARFSKMLMNLSAIGGDHPRETGSVYGSLVRIVASLKNRTRRGESGISGFGLFPSGANQHAHLDLDLVFGLEFAMAGFKESLPPVIRFSFDDYDFGSGESMGGVCFGRKWRACGADGAS